MFPQGINPKENAITWLEFEFAYYDIKVHGFVMYSHNHNDIKNNSTYTYTKAQADSNTKATPLLMSST